MKNFSLVCVGLLITWHCVTRVEMDLLFYDISLLPTRGFTSPSLKTSFPINPFTSLLSGLFEPRSLSHSWWSSVYPGGITKRFFVPFFPVVVLPGRGGKIGTNIYTIDSNVGICIRLVRSNFFFEVLKSAQKYCSHFLKKSRHGSEYSESLRHTSFLLCSFWWAGKYYKTCYRSETK